MILQALLQLAEHEHLMEDPDFQEVPVAWWITLDIHGKFLGMQDKRYLLAATGKGKPKPITPRLSVPMRIGRTAGVRAQFFVDNAQYTFGLLQDMEGKKAERARECFDAYREEIKACAETTQDPGAKALLAFLNDLASGVQAVPWNDEWESNHVFAFALADTPDEPVHLRPAIRDYWIGQRKQGTGDAAGAPRCLVTGVPVAETGLFPQIKKVPGGSTSGVGLVSFNSSAFESYGWKRNENAPISRGAAEACSTALNRLLDTGYPDPRDPGVTLPLRNYRLSADTVVCYWSPTKSGDALCDLLTGAVDPKVELVGDLYSAIWRGDAPQRIDPSAFYAMTITGTQGRLVVRDWFESTVGTVFNNVVQYFRDIDIVRNTPAPKSGPLPPNLPLRVLLRALAVRGDDKRLAPNAAAQLFHCIVGGSLFPMALLHAAVSRTRAEASESEWLDLERRDARAAIIKASLNRMRRKSPGAANRIPEVPREMDTEHPIEHPGYLLGRLLALLEKLQSEALGEVNATVVDRYFKRAVTTPRAVFTHLLKLRSSHERKLKRDKGGLAITRQRQIDELLHAIDEETGIPATLTLEGQSLFILGYHHQRYALWKKKEHEETAPDAEAVVG